MSASTRPTVPAAAGGLHRSTPAEVGPNGSAADRVRALTHGASHFFGFHDLCPWDEGGRMLVCLRTATPESRLPEAQDVAEVCVVDEDSGRARAVGATRAWNWQQGARQRWLPGTRKALIVYNVETERGFGARMLDVETGESDTLDWPVYDVAPGGGFALGVDFDRLGRLYRSYGYRRAHTGRPRATALTPDDEDGIFRIDLQTGERELLLPIAEVTGATGRALEPGGHFFTHVSIAPDGRRYCFLHRRLTASGGVATDLIVADLAAGEWSVLARDRVSHFDWWDANHIVAWTRRNAAIRKMKDGRLGAVARPLFRLSRKIRGQWLRRRVYRESFRAYDVTSRACRPFAAERLAQDGHPQVNPRFDQVWVIDTYPDRWGLQSLMLYDSSRDERLDLARLATPASISGTGWRCDLHPRWDPTGRKVCVDSAHLGRRQLCVVDVSSEVQAWTETG